MTGDRPKIYLAGPEVFHPEARRLGDEKRAICAAAGLEGAYPLDNELDLAGLGKAAQAHSIALANEALMRSCDALIANLTPFRGTSMDAGTAFEVGFMRGLGRPVFGYSNTAIDYADRCRSYRGGPRPAFDVDSATLDVEDFDLPENLMIAVAMSESGLPVVVAQAGGGLAPSLDDLSVFRACVALVAKRLSAATEIRPGAAAQETEPK
jgi:nucleoside 2-deoxyribosyltransferase